jgi:hypothetical protein
MSRQPYLVLFTNVSDDRQPTTRPPASDMMRFSDRKSQEFPGKFRNIRKRSGNLVYNYIIFMGF